MAVVETERHGQILVVRMNRPERLNALNHELRSRLAETWTEFRHNNELEVAIFTGAGRAFCAGEDMKESLKDGAPGGRRPAPSVPLRPVCTRGRTARDTNPWIHGDRFGQVSPFPGQHGDPVYLPPAVCPG
jgi:enoyl-CoA hydratase/carnithine racemase